MQRYDALENYCRRLGDCVTFRYCRSVSTGLPCAGILDCWYHRLPIQEYIATNYSREQIDKVFTAVRSRVETLAEIVARVSATVRVDEEEG